MCIAIYKPAGIDIPKETLIQCNRANNDGAGMAYSIGRGMRIRKGYFNFEDFYAEYLEHKDKQMLIHFRIATHGKIEKENCHPFFVTKNLAFIHNGIISHHGGNKDISDTRDFNYKILRPMVKQFGEGIIFKKEFRHLIEQYIGYSKLSFLHADGRVSIANALKGEWSNGVWYSNSSYRPYIPPVRTTEYDDYYPANHSLANHSWKKKSRVTVTPINSSITVTRAMEGDIISRGSNGLIMAGDEVEVNYPYKGLKKGDYVLIKKVLAYAQCEIELEDGSIIPSFPGCYLDPIILSKQTQDIIVND